MACSQRVSWSPGRSGRSQVTHRPGRGGCGLGSAKQAVCLPVCGEDEGGLGLQGSDPRALLRSGDE
jgi:hypothetical protein